MSWTLSPDAAAASLALRRPYPYEGGGPWDSSFCVERAVPHAVRLAAMLRRTFPWIQTIGAAGHERCTPMHTTRMDPETHRRVPGPDVMNVHSIGRALDVMVPAGPDRVARGTALANWLVQNAGELGVQLAIWDRSAWQGSLDEPRLRPYRGPNPHTDHVHVEVKLAPGPALTEPGPEENPGDPDFLRFNSSVTAQAPRVPNASSPDYIPAPLPGAAGSPRTPGEGSGWGLLVLVGLAVAVLSKRR